MSSVGSITKSENYWTMIIHKNYNIRTDPL